MLDVEVMFYEVRVNFEDCSVLRFFWWFDGNLDLELEEIMMIVYLFGVVFFFSCVNFVLRKIRVDN